MQPGRQNCASKAKTRRSHVRASVRRSKTGPNVVDIRFLVSVLCQLQMSNLEPEYSNCEGCQNDQSVYEEDGSDSRKGPQGP